MPKRAKSIVVSLSADLFKNPRQIHTLNRIHQRRSLSTISSRTVLNKKFINSPQHSSMTNEPVIIHAVGDLHQQNGSQKWASSLATAQQPVIINGGHHNTPHHKHPHSSSSSIHHKDKAATMGMHSIAWLATLKFQIPLYPTSCEPSSESGESCPRLSIVQIFKSNDVLLELERKRRISTSRFLPPILSIDRIQVRVSRQSSLYQCALVLQSAHVQYSGTHQIVSRANPSL